MLARISLVVIHESGKVSILEGFHNLVTSSESTSRKSQLQNVQYAAHDYLQSLTNIAPDLSEMWPHTFRRYPSWIRDVAWDTLMTLHEIRPR